VSFFLIIGSTEAYVGKLLLSATERGRILKYSLR